MAKELSVNDVITAGAFNTSTSEAAAPASGQSGIFHFPFRIHSREELQMHAGAGPNFRFRVHAPFLVRKTGSPVTEDVPKELWPNFTWHTRAPKEMRTWCAAPDLHYGSDGKNAICYDGLRVDVWGPDAANRPRPFVLSAMRWLRFLSGQPWISDVDRHYTSTEKRAFPIDDFGAAVHEAIGITQVRLANFRLVTDQMWRQCFDYAAQLEVPVYCNLYFDAINAAAIDDYPRAIMNLAMALESARDINFSKIHDSDFLPGRGYKLKAPFNSTDLLKHLTVHSKTVFGSDFSEDHPEHWPYVRNLYVARQHVAHGKGAVVPTDSGLYIVDKHLFLSMQMAAGVALRWMELLAKSRKC